MVKYGKYLATQVKQDWADFYIDYNRLKVIITELVKAHKEKQFKGLGIGINEQEESLIENEENYNKKTEITNHTISTPMNNHELEDPLEKILKTNKGKYVKKFLDAVENEINKFYDFFISLENKLNIEIAKEIFKENQIHEAENCFEAIIIALERLENIVFSIQELCEFLNLNVTAIRKILKKFDKRFTNQELPVSYFFLQSKLKSANSSLVKILQFKTIDEASAIVEQILERLNYKFSKALTCLDSENINQMLDERLLKAFNFSKMIKFDKHQVENLFNEKFSKLKNEIQDIDQANQVIRSNVDIWSIMARENIKMVNDLYTRGKKSSVSYIENEKILENLTKNVKTNLKYGNSNNSLYYHHMYSAKSNYDYSIADLKNNLNIWLLLTHTLLYTMNQYVILPNNFLFIHYLGYHELWTGLVLAVTPLGSILGQTLYFKIQNTYKLPLMLSCFSFILGNLLYVLAYSFNSIVLMFIGRFLIGMGGARSVIRRYFIEHFSNDKLSYYSFYFVSIVYVGIALGPAISFISYLFPDLNNGIIMLNHFTYPAFIPLIIWIAYFFIFLILYSDFVGITIKETGDADIDKSTNSGNIYASHKEGNGSSSPHNNTNINTEMVNMNTNSNFNLNNNSSNNNFGASNNNNNISNNDNALSFINYSPINFINNEISLNFTNKSQVYMIIDKEIETIIEAQRNSFSYINLAYFTLVCLFLLIRVTIENLLVFAPVYLNFYHGFNVSQVCIFLMLTSVSIIPISIIINHWLMSVEERKMILSMLILSLISLTFLSSVHIQTRNYWNYFVVYSCLLVMANIMETFVSCLYSKIISSKISGYSGIIIICCTTGGKVIGCILVSIFLYYRYSYHKFPWIALGIFYSFISIITIKNYKHLKVRAISRILKKRDL